jgi:hypothetical protein
MSNKTKISSLVPRKMRRFEIKNLKNLEINKKFTVRRTGGIGSPMFENRKPIKAKKISEDQALKYLGWLQMQKKKKTNIFKVSRIGIITLL